MAVGFEAPDVLRKYVDENDLTDFRPATITGQSDVAAVASRTPTIVLVSQSGKVLTSWTGKMTSKQMDAVIALHHIGADSK
jgi:hypothetical protein